jgi:hypothetical protein
VSIDIRDAPNNETKYLMAWLINQSRLKQEAIANCKGKTIPEGIRNMKALWDSRLQDVLTRMIAGPMQDLLILSYERIQWEYVAAKFQ